MGKRLAVEGKTRRFGFGGTEVYRYFNYIPRTVNHKSLLMSFIVNIASWPYPQPASGRFLSIKLLVYHKIKLRLRKMPK